MTNNEFYTCSCCGAKIRTWKKPINSTGVAALCRLVAIYDGENPVHLDKFNVIPKDRNFSQLYLWDLIEPELNEDTSKRASGKWYPTQLGINFVHGNAKVPKYVVTRLNKLQRFEGPMIGVNEALRSKFDYQELLDIQKVA